jgi:DNA primase
MTMANDNLREEIRDRVRLDELIGQYVSLRRAGRRLTGLCPFHAEKTPSFNVDPEKGFWRCFGCQVGGDVFDFVQRIENLTFVEALERLARQVGLPFTRRGEGKERASEKEQLFDVHALAQRFYREQLKQHPAVLQYLHSRGLEPETIERFGIGYAPRTWDALLGSLSRQNAGMPWLMAAARQASLVRDGNRGPYDYFVDRVTFPIRDIEGRVVAFGARGLGADAKPKYLNSPESPIFTKGRIWYGLDLARDAMQRERAAVAVEGYLDVIALHQAGIEHAVANLGTAITPRHVEILRRYAGTVLLAYDGDSAGIQATLRAGAICEEAEFPVRVVELPPGEDPDTLVRRQGAAAFRALLGAAGPLLDHRLKRIRGRYNLKDPSERLAMVTEAAKTIAESRSHVVREEYAARLIGIVKELPALERVDVDLVQNEEAALLSEIRRIVLGAESARMRKQASSRPGANGAAGAGSAADPRPPLRSARRQGTLPPPAASGQQEAERIVLRAALGDPTAWAGRVAARLRPDQFADPDCHRIAQAFLGNNMDEAIAAAAAVARDSALAEVVSKLLVVEDGAVEEPVFAECLERVARYGLRARLQQLKKEIVEGTEPATDQRYLEYSRLEAVLRNPAVKGDG